MKLTANQVAIQLNCTPFTIKRWYNWWHNLSNTSKKMYLDSGMPLLPEYEVGSNNWRYWDESCIEQLQKFKTWIPKTRNGVFNKK